MRLGGFDGFGAIGRLAAAGALVVLTGCGTTVAGDDADPGGTDAPPPVPAETPTTTAPPTPPAPVSDPDTAAPADGAPCQPSQLLLESGFVDAATGYRETTVVASNTSDLPCTVDGLPDVRAVGDEGTPYTLTRVDGVWTSPGLEQPEEVLLTPGAQAEIRLGWRADGASADAEWTGALQLVLVPDGPGYGVAIDPGEWPLPIVDAQEVRTSGWRPSTGVVTNEEVTELMEQEAAEILERNGQEPPEE